MTAPAKTQTTPRRTPSRRTSPRRTSPRRSCVVGAYVGLSRLDAWHLAPGDTLTLSAGGIALRHSYGVARYAADLLPAYRPPYAAWAVVELEALTPEIASAFTSGYFRYAIHADSFRPEATIVCKLAWPDLIQAVHTEGIEAPQSVLASVHSYKGVAPTTRHNSAALAAEYQAAAVATGNDSTAYAFDRNSVAVCTGARSIAVATAAGSGAVVVGESSLSYAGGPGTWAVASAYGSQAAGVVGATLHLSEKDDEGNLLSCESVLVDGVDFKPDVWYFLVDGVVTGDVDYVGCVGA